MSDIEKGVSVELGGDWFLDVRENQDTYTISLHGPKGEGAAFSPERRSVRADVLRLFLEQQLSESDA